jgi:hypothetical protein
MDNLNFRNYIIATLFFLCFGVISCVSVKPIYYDDDKKVAESHVEKFHQLFNEEKYNDLFDFYTPKGRNQSSREQLIIDLQNLRSKYGFIKNSKLVKSEVKPQSSTRLVHMFYETEFEKGKVIEEFDCLVDGQNAIFDYYGQPDKIPDNIKK